MTDAGLEYLALPKHSALHCRLEHLALNHLRGATERGVCQLLERCSAGRLRSLGIRGLLFNADDTLACIARNCRRVGRGGLCAAWEGGGGLLPWWGGRAGPACSAPLLPLLLAKLHKSDFGPEGGSLCLAS